MHQKMSKMQKQLADQSKSAVRQARQVSKRRYPGASKRCVGCRDKDIAGEIIIKNNST